MCTRLYTFASENGKSPANLNKKVMNTKEKTLLAESIVSRLLANADDLDTDEVGRLMKEILLTEASAITVKDGATLTEAVDRLPSELCQVKRIALIVFYNPLSPMMMSDLASLAHFTAKFDPEADIRWTSASTDMVPQDRFIIAIISDKY